MKKYNLYTLVFLLCLLFSCFSGTVMAQKKGTTVTAKIVDASGNPLSGVKVRVPKGSEVVTDADGQFEVVVSGKEFIAFQKSGFESKFLQIDELSGDVVLTEMPFLGSEQDVVKMGISTRYRRDMTGAVSTINPAERLTYDNTQRVKDYIDGLLLGMKDATKVRGLGTSLFVIDGVIGRNPDILNMEEIDQITVLKDANAVALYGSVAKNGVIIINTKRGEANTKKANVNIRYGINDPISLPNYLGSADYMTLYNEARANDGMEALYDDETIENFRSGTNKYRYPDTDVYSSEYLRSHTNRADVTTEFSGGNKKTRYYVNMGWNYAQSLVKTNPEANKGSNRFNVRGNMDFQINDWISSSLDGVAIINSNQSSHTNLLSKGTTLKPHEYAPLLPIDMMDLENNPELAAQVKAARQYGDYLLGGSQQYKSDSPIGDVIAGGTKNSMYRSTQFNNSIDFDLNRITEGLSARTYLSFDFYDAYNLKVVNEYKVYEPTWDGDRIVALTPYGDVDLKGDQEKVSSNGFTSRTGFYGLLNYDRSFGKHSIYSTFLGSMYSIKENKTIQTDRSAHMGFQFSYDYNKKFYLDFSGAYLNSIKLPEGGRGGFSPTVGLAYVLKDSQNTSDIVNYFKLKATGGILKSDQGIDEYYLYNETYSDGSSFTWADGQSSNKAREVEQGGNVNMGYEERLDLNLGFESYFMNSLWVEFNLFQTDMDKQLAMLKNSYPSYYQTFIPYDNFNKDRYQGFELGLDYKKQINDLTVSLGANVLYMETEVMTRDEIYEYDYQNRVGKSKSAIFGLVDDGFYSVDDFTKDAAGNYILNSGLEVPSYGAVQPGDIKYIDQNGDNVIDNTDQVEIGDTSNPWTYGLNVRLKYKGLSLFVLGKGQFGGQANLSNDYYWVDGNDKYSDVVLGRWTEETANSATFPRLTTKTNKNNFQKSTFWMYDKNYFKISRAQLTYEFSDAVCSKVGMKKLSVNVSGSNLLYFAKNKEYQQLTIGSSPQYRSFMFGVRTSF